MYNGLFLAILYSACVEKVSLLCLTNQFQIVTAQFESHVVMQIRLRIRTSLFMAVELSYASRLLANSVLHVQVRTVRLFVGVLLF